MGQRVLITGVSRASGIGATLAKRMARTGASVALHGFADYDGAMGYADAQNNATQELAQALQSEGLSAYALTPSDLSHEGAPEKAVNEAHVILGPLDGLIINHAYSTHAPIGEWTASHIDAHLLTNIRAAMLLTQSFVAQAIGGGAITLFTSGQYLGSMTDEIAYAVSKDALIGLCRQLSYALAHKKIRVNAINPGPNDTGYLTGEAYAEVANRFPSGRWGTPEDAADLVLFLHSQQAGWITGQVIASEGGFNRYG